MKFFKSLIISLIGFFLVVFPVLAQDFPQAVGYVNDFGEMLSSDFRQSLEEDLTKFEEETQAEIAVVTVNSLEGTYIEDYAVRLFEQWGIGKKEEDNGLLILIAKEEREFRIEVGYGLEPIITDGRAGRILREQMTPSFKEGNYDQGVRLAVEKIQEYVRSGEPPPPEAAKELPEKAPPFIALIIFIFIIFVYTSAFLARSKSFWAGGVLGGIFGAILGVIIGGLAAIFFSALGLALIGLILDFILSKNYKTLKKRKKSTGFFSSWGGFSKGGGGGGGFGGFGGGSSGGGGASGGW
jgi:uncharacterized protein